MTRLADGTRAFGAPGIEPRWTRGMKDAVGTARSTASRVWFTVSAGVLTEVYYPTVDRPQIRDLLFMATDGETFFHDERRHCRTETGYLDDRSLAVRVTSREPEHRYTITKEIIADPRHECVLQRVRIGARDDVRDRLRLFALLAPHLDAGGRGNTGHAARVNGRTVLTAHRNGIWLALGASVPIARRSCGFVGYSDGWQDLAADRRMDWEFDTAENGNIALTAELDWRADGGEFTLGLAFGHGLNHAISTLLQSLATPWREQRRHYLGDWRSGWRGRRGPEAAAGDGGDLYRRSVSILLAHEDKTFPGAIIASLSIPWGEALSGDELGGYHLVWTRDLVHVADGLLAAGDMELPRRALVYLATAQREDGGFHQNFWIDGTPYWTGIQLDEIAFPILLAWRLHRAGALDEFDPYPMVLAAAGALVRIGPSTPQERWEEASGHSPSTLACVIAALMCASCMAGERGDETTATFLREHADFLETRIETWTVTSKGTILRDVPRHYIRINPVVPGSAHPDEDPDSGTIVIANRAPGARAEFPAHEIVDAGFLELVRFGIRRADDPLMEDSLRVVDALLRVKTPYGPCWRRYNHDGYGQRDDGGPYVGWGRGRAWPLLTGERGHYEVAAGRDPASHIRAMEGFASEGGLLPEQVWDAPDLPAALMYLGRATGSAQPLTWAHAEYIRLLRSAADGEVFDRIPEIAERYLNARRGRARPEGDTAGTEGAGRSTSGGEREPGEVWKFNRQVERMSAGGRLRILAAAPFRLRWTAPGREKWSDLESTATRVGVYFADLDTPREPRGAIRFTFFWPESARWEGRDFEVRLTSSETG